MGRRTSDVGDVGDVDDEQKQELTIKKKYFFISFVVPLLPTV